MAAAAGASARLRPQQPQLLPLPPSQQPPLPAPPPASVSVPILASLDCEFLELSAEGARLFDAAADGALGGDHPERASLFSFRQLVVVEAAEAAPAAAGSAGAGPSETPVPAPRRFEIEIDVDRVPNTSGGGGSGEARAEPLAFLTLRGPGWVRVAELLGLAPGWAVMFEKDPETGFVHASRTSRWI